ncbi:hypothetical protein [Mucilaginibacter flavidus]|uniref:hypothetical protein n=1 Tax=Mucilaginibacter flavidus TaxID=2949309 RepID=UPI002092A2CD|nr:hypothetical protein [Mucilaginibacter flavidus]MCO5948195.1 hypothetical protein [Mucilaginibacter flavidus]
MKKLTLIFLLTVTFSVGNARGLYQHEPASEKLVLNNGAKWKVDKITYNNVNNLQQIAKPINAKSLKEYHMAGVALQNGITKMIRECRMKGTDHQALHKWLEPLMELGSKLSRATDAAAAARLYKETTAQLNLFNRYFQL